MKRVIERQVNRMSDDLIWEFAPEEIGKTVFLTREEAEKALEEMRI